METTDNDYTPVKADRSYSQFSTPHVARLVGVGIGNMMISTKKIPLEAKTSNKNDVVNFGSLCFSYTSRWRWRLIKRLYGLQHTERPRITDRRQSDAHIQTRFNQNV